jgi:xanthine dehydrogenase/oxidase
MIYTDEYVTSIVTRLSVPYTRTLTFFINKSEQTVKSVDPQTLLIDYLRDNGYTGTKYGCGEGGCGACTVVVAEYDMSRKLVKYQTANSCLLLLCSLHCKQVITVEGLGNQSDPHPVQVSQT